MAHNYKDLFGGLGRNTVYRGERITVVEITDPEVARLRIGNEYYPVLDISISGLSFLTQNTDNLPVAGAVDVAQLLLRDSVVYDGKIEIVRYEQIRNKAKVGVKLLSGFLNISAFRRRAEETRLHNALEHGPGPTLGHVPSDYRQAIEALAFTVQFYRVAFDNWTMRCGSDSDRGDIGQRLIEKGLASARGPWVEGRERATLAAKLFLEDPKTLAAAKRYTETLLTALLLDAPGIRRAYMKPLGYPGDYQTMLYMYENTFCGDTLFARVFHKICVEEPMAEAVRTRKEFLIELHRREYQRATAQTSEFTVLNLGCGPATEATEFSEAFVSPVRKTHWTLIDQEEKALSLAHRRAYEQHVYCGRGTVNCLYVSFTQLLQDFSLLASISDHDFVYCTGIFDYLRQPLAKSLARILWTKVRPGGALAIGNAVKPSSCFWFAELVLDWTLIYRTPDEIFDLVAQLPGTESIEIEAEPSNVFQFAIVRKKAESAA